ncbi:patched domain-containing protein 3 [Tachysurus vachellii]|uniref:patched domain-containing protein 3 n=1 Tax=Tachysurus vachellii TaxID=175792 RepID=UPI00296B29E2|nr:patched domain-containing protein 3 [Tachysurus vachellii]
MVTMVFTTNCVEKPVRSCLESLGRFIGRHPWWFIVIPISLSSALGVGFYFVEDRKSNDIVKQFTPRDGQAKAEKHFFESFFQSSSNKDKNDDDDDNDDEDDDLFSALRLSTDGTYASAIFTCEMNVLSEDALTEILHVDKHVRKMTVKYDGREFSYSDVCARVNESCQENILLKVLDYNAINIHRFNLTFPVYHDNTFGAVRLEHSVGHVEVDGDGFVQSAKAVRLTYYLRQTNNVLENAWLDDFVNLLSNKSTYLTQVSYFTSISRQQEFEKSTESVTMLFSITYFIAIAFSVLSCIRLDNVRNKVWVASLGVISTGLAVLSGFGLLLLMDVPFVITVASSPFLVLGIGIDDMFIMISCWQQTNVQDSVEDRMAATYREAAISITITTLTDVVAFCLSYSNPFGSVRSFCLYAGTAILFCYLFNITFFGACLALNGKREESNRHWMTCLKVPEERLPGSSKAYVACCVGGTYNHETGNEDEHLMKLFFRKYYGPFLTTGFAKATAVLLYVGYIATSIYGCTTIKEGIDLKNLAVDQSYVVEYYEAEKTHFGEYGPIVMLAVNTTFPYWDEVKRAQLESCILKFLGLPFVENLSTSWLHSFESYAKEKHLNIKSKVEFMEHLHHFLQGQPMLRLDVNMTDDAIQASRLFLQTVDVPSEKILLETLRKLAQTCQFPLVVYHPAFIYYDQYTVIASSTIQTVSVATAVMLVISFLLIPSPVCALWVTFAIGSVIVGVAGFMGLLGINLDSISMINLVISIGFSVDFSAHISYTFVSSAKPSVNDKAVEALSHLGYPILQGALSTILGVAVLSASVSYIFRTFFTIMFLVISLGLLHGIAFIPVFLTFSGFCVKF